MNGRPAVPARVLIDASLIRPTVDGLSVYIINLIKNLPDRNQAEFEFTVLLNPDVEWPDLEAAMKIRGIQVLRRRVAHIGPLRDWHMWRFFRRHRGEFDLIHITSNHYPLALKGGICTIHDVTFKRWFHDPGGIPGARVPAVAYLTCVIRNCLRRARRIITDSEATRQEIRRTFGATPPQMQKMEVVHLGWEHLLQDVHDDPQPLPYSPGSFIFFLGSFRPHKNLHRLLKGFQLALDELPEDKFLVISGSSDRLAESVKATVGSINARGERVIFTGYLSNADVHRHYAQADAFILPSLAEGFGLPVLEAFYHGIPLLCSNTTSLPEIAGDAALYFDPTDEASIAQAIVSLYREPGLRASLVQRGQNRLHEFSWKRTAERTVEIYRQELELSPMRGRVPSQPVEI